MAKQLALIPACLLIPALLLLLRVRRGGDPAWWGCLTCCVLLYAVSTPLVAGALVGPLQGRGPPLDVGAGTSGAQAIVVLSAEAVPAPEYGGTTIGPVTLARVRYGARLHRATGLPILVTGGTPPVGGVSLAAALSYVVGGLALGVTSPRVVLVVAGGLGVAVCAAAGSVLLRHRAGPVTGL